MEKALYTIIALSFFITSVYAQNLGINTSTPNASAILDIKSSTKGLLIPRTSTTSRIAIATPAKGLMVYDTTSSSFWFYNGSAWTNMATGSGGSGWSLTGNAGTNPVNNFIGTTDDNPLLFRIKNTWAGIIDSPLKNTAIGFNALTGSNTGNSNSAFGYNALAASTPGSGNTAIGNAALSMNGTGANFAADEGKNNTAVGNGSMQANTTGLYNTAIGVGSLQANTSGFFNAAMGYGALGANTYGRDNTAIGLAALNVNVGGQYNTAVGSRAMQANMGGTNNTAHGTNALGSNTAGSNNTAVGYNSLYYNVTGNNNTAIGYSAAVSADALSNATAIGANSVVYQDNSLVLGSITGLNSATSSTKVGIGTPSPQAPLHIHSVSTTNLGTANTTLILDDNHNVACIRFQGIGTYYNRYFKITTYPVSDVTGTGLQLRFGSNFTEPIFTIHEAGGADLYGTLTQSSDSRLKTNIGLFNNALTAILHLSGYTYQWKDKNLDQKQQIGLLAQEVQEVLPQLVKTDDRGMLGVNYIGMIPVLLSGIKEQQQMIEDLKKENTEIKKTLKEVLALISKK